MNSTIFIPEKIKVGYNERSDTYTKRLAYVIYYGRDKKLKKEKSWRGWMQEKLGSDDYDNVPTEGFVLNKKAGGYNTGWNHRQAKIRVYDPRGFEFEITIENMLFILENTNSIKGKGLEGEFVYGWDKDQILLIPTSSPDYIELSEFNDKLRQKVVSKGKELVVGGKYRLDDNREAIYMGRFESFQSWKGNSEGLKYFFAFIYSTVKKGGKQQYSFDSWKSVTTKVIEVLSTEPVEDYAYLFSEMEKVSTYSPHDRTREMYIPYTLEEFIKDRSKDLSRHFHTEDGKEPFVIRQEHDYSYYHNTKREDNYYAESLYSKERIGVNKGTLAQIFNALKPMHLDLYLPNGKVYELKTKKYYPKVKDKPKSK